MARKTELVVSIPEVDLLLALLNQFAESMADGLLAILSEMEDGSDQAIAVGQLMSRCLQFKEDLLATAEKSNEPS